MKPARYIVLWKDDRGIHAVNDSQNELLVIEVKEDAERIAATCGGWLVELAL